MSEGQETTGVAILEKQIGPGHDLNSSMTKSVYWKNQITSS